MDQKTLAVVNDTTQQLCKLIQEKMNSCSAEDHEQLPNLITALAILVHD
ncbi:hypothetical protein [Paenibacillus larvae]|uniref:Uncharacterized protein n=1 Tax=Paenibacillus larvae subsp. larvae TaxID=147375 RepID=A0A6C0QUM9_9BACL|nr:hypothetical protein [Paenibacillus larvae]QHZ52372.1 hypothetical protein ERICV_03260 [Paenibacillus larvae subsp. larvae]